MADQDAPRLLSDDDVMGGNLRPLSDADVLGHAQPDKKEVPIYARPLVGANRAIADLAGAPVDATTFLLNKGAQAATWAANKALGTSMEAPQIKNPIGGSGTFKSAMGVIGANPDDVRPAATRGEKLLEAAGEGAASMLVPGLAAEAALARAPTVDGAIKAAFDILKGTGPASNVAIGAASGVGGEAAAEAVPEEYAPAAHIVGSLAAGVGAAGAVGAAERAGAAVGRTASRAIEPAEVAAARRIEERAANPERLRAYLSNATVGESIEAAAPSFANAIRDDLPLTGGPVIGRRGDYTFTAPGLKEPETVPGSTPTTFQATGDLGVGALEREVATNQGAVERFAARRAEQNAARQKALNSLADGEANPEAVTDFVRAQLGVLSEDHAARVKAATQQIAERLAVAGGDRFDNHAAYGEALRGPLTELHQAAKEEASRLWRAIDPDLSAPVQSASLKQAAARLIDSIPQAARPPLGEESSILRTIAEMGDTTHFGNLVALRSRLTDAMREERRSGTPTVLRRLGIMLDNVDNTLANTAGEIAANPQLAPAIERRLQNWVDDWYQRRTNEGTGVTAGESLGTGDQGDVVGRPGGVSSARGTPGETRGPAGNSPGDQGLPEATGADVGERYGAARQATRELKQTFESGPVGAVLAPGAQYGSFRTTASNVAKRLFDRPEDLRAFVEAAKDSPEALSAMRDYAAFSLRQAAVRDGMLSPPRFDAWVRDHSYVFDQFPDLKAKFSNLKSAQTTLDEAMATQKQALADYQTKTVTDLLRGDDPVKAVGRSLSRLGDLASLVEAVKDNPTAMAGLKRAAVEHMLGVARSTAEAGTSEIAQINPASLQKFFLNNRRALGDLFSKDELATISNVISDLQQANRSIVAVKIPGGSNTPQDLSGRLSTMLQRFVHEAGGKVAGAVAGSHAGPIGSAVGFAAGAAADVARAGRAAVIDAALTDMMLSPKMAALWLQKVPRDAGPGYVENFGRRVKAMAAAEIERAIEENGAGNRAAEQAMGVR